MLNLWGLNVFSPSVLLWMTLDFTFSSMSVAKLGSMYFIMESRTTIDVHYSVSIASEEIRQIKLERVLTSLNIST